MTNAGAAHLEGFGSLEGVATGKGEMFRALPVEGVAVINADDVYAAHVARCQRRRARADVRLRAARGFHGAQGRRAAATRADSASTSSSSRRTARVPRRLALAGLHNLRNALGAAAVACAAGAEIEDIVAGLAAMKTVAGRLELKPAIKGAFVVDDSYNANPSSLKAGLDAFRSFSGDALAGARRDEGARRQRR